MFCSTKYLGGHSDVLAGVASTRTVDLWTKLHLMRTIFGSCLVSKPIVAVNIVLTGPTNNHLTTYTDDVIKRKHFPRHWPFDRGIHQSLVDSPQRPQRRSFDVFFDLRLNKRWNNQECRWFENHRAQCDVTVMCYRCGEMGQHKKGLNGIPTSLSLLNIV